MEIILKNLKITNFKGIKSFESDFANETDIRGDNATGKSTIEDANSFVLFGKDSSGKSDFSIKPLDANGNTKDDIESEVIATYIIDGQETVFKKIYKEKHTQVKGSQQTVFAGNTTLHFINDVPKKSGEYQQYIKELFDTDIKGVNNEELFKILTNVTYFNTLKWDEKRKILFNLTNEASEADAIETDQRFKDFVDKIGSKSIEDYRKEVKYKITELKKSKESIPARIDELHRNMPELKDEKLIENKINVLKAEIDKIETSLNDAAKLMQEKNKENEQKQGKIYALKEELSELEFKHRQEHALKFKNNFADLDQKIMDLNRLTNRLSLEKDNLTEADRILNELNNEITSLRERYVKISGSTLTFDDDKFSCPTCKRPYDTGNIEAQKAKMLTDFNNQKATDLDKINKEGLDIKRKIENRQGFINQTKKDIELLEADIKILSDFIRENPKKEYVSPEFDYSVIPGYSIKKAEIETLQKEIVQIQTSDNSSLIQDKKVKFDELNELQREFDKKKYIDEYEQRIEELTKSKVKISQDIADLEKHEYLMDDIEKVRVEMTEGKINSLFKKAKFRMYNKLINGGYEATCVILVDGVPYSDANTAKQINYGLDIINTLSKKFKIKTPVWIDNAESVVHIEKTENQVIRLTVDEMAKSLLVKNY